jgi:hypothetical protein
MLVSIAKLASITGKDRKTIIPRIAHLPSKAGEKGAKLYESPAALAAIYTRDSASGNLDEARRRQADSAAHLNELRGEEISKTRIPIDIPIRENDQITQSIAATLKAARGKTLSLELINELLGKFRDLPAKLKW